MQDTPNRTWTVTARDTLGTVGPWRLQFWNYVLGYLPLPFIEWMGFGEFQVVLKANDTGEKKFVVCSYPHMPGTTLKDGDWKYEVDISNENKDLPVKQGN